jgi:hypothetical protein
MKLPAEGEGPVLNDVRWLRPVGLVLLVLGVAACVQAAWGRGSDFAPVYFTSVGLTEKLPIYDFSWQHAAFPARTPFGPPQGMFYPPGTGVMTLPLGLFTFPVARVMWFVAMCSTVVLGVRALVLLTWPERGALGWPLVVGGVLLSACLRWGMAPQQGAPLILGVLGLFTVALYQRQFTLALVLAAFAVAFKSTLALPFLGLLFLYRRYASAAIAVGCMVLANLLGFARLGGTSAWHAYQQNVAVLESLSDINTPDPWNLISVPRTDWTYLFYGLSRNLHASRLAALACVGLTGLWLLWQANKVRTPTLANVGAFMFAFACLTNLSVYHHHYDLSLLLVPMLLLGFGAPELRRPATPIWLMLPLVSMMALLPIALVERFFGSHFGVIGRGLVNISFSVVLTLTFVGALLLVRRTTTTLSRVVAPTRSGGESVDSVG